MEYDDENSDSHYVYQDPYNVDYQKQYAEKAGGHKGKEKPRWFIDSILRK